MIRKLLEYINRNAAIIYMIILLIFIGYHLYKLGYNHGFIDGYKESHKSIFGIIKGYGDSIVKDFKN